MAERAAHRQHHLVLALGQVTWPVRGRSIVIGVGLRADLLGLDGRRRPDHGVSEWFLTLRSVREGRIGGVCRVLGVFVGALVSGSQASTRRWRSGRPNGSQNGLGNAIDQFGAGIGGLGCRDWRNPRVGRGHHAADQGPAGADLGVCRATDAQLPRLCDQVSSTRATRHRQRPVLGQVQVAEVEDGCAKCLLQSVRKAFLGDVAADRLR